MFSIQYEGNTSNDFSSVEQFQQIAASILLMQQSFEIQNEKLRIARINGVINDKEYGQWVECFDSLRREWLEKDFAMSENILFLNFMSRQYHQMGKALKFPAK